jgi:acetyltransferase-like isoleucine patch superfamily enzyme
MRTSHGTGFEKREELRLGEGTIIEASVQIFNAANIEIGKACYIGHGTILKGYTINNRTSIRIGDGTWMGECVYAHGAGQIDIRGTLEEPVGIGPYVKILTSYHDLEGPAKPAMRNPLVFDGVILERGCDIGIGTILLPGVTIGEGAIVGAGSVVTRNVAPYAIVCGNPARMIRMRSFPLL